MVWGGVAHAAHALGADADVARFQYANDEPTGVANVDAVGAANASDAGSRSIIVSVAPQGSNVDPLLFDADADYTLLTRYGSNTEVALADYLAQGISGITFSLASCDDSHVDYYPVVRISNGSLLLESNTLGHVHGSNTQTETVCTVTATGSNGSQDQEFRFYTVSDRLPLALPQVALTIAETRSSSADVRIDLPGGSLGYGRLGWRKAGEPPRFAVAYGVSDGSALTIEGLEPQTDYEVRAYLMTAQAFDLYRMSNTGPRGALISEGSPDSKWIANLSGGGLGKSQSGSFSTPEATIPPTRRPTPDEEEDEDEDDTPTATDNDGTDSDGIDTPTPTDNDGVETPYTDDDGVDTTDNDGINTPYTDNDGVDTTDNDGIETPYTDNDGVDTTDNDNVDTTDDDWIDTPQSTDNDGTDSDGIDTPTTDDDGVSTPYTDNDGVDTTDNDGIDTPTPTDNDGTDSDGVDTPTPETPTSPESPDSDESGSGASS